MRLYLVQHGDAVPKVTDPDRPLSPEGRHAVERLAAFLARLDLGVVRVLHSGKARAAQTAELLLWAVGSHLRAETRDGIAPDDPVEELAADLAGWSGPDLLVGHLPFLRRLVGLLVQGDAAAELVRITPGTALCLERDPAGTWQVVWCIPPEAIPG
jgi:phosphohistidine phosphatase